MKLTKIESIVFRFMVEAGKSKAQLRKWLNKIKLSRLQDSRSFWEKIGPLDKPLRESRV